MENYSTYRLCFNVYMYYCLYFCSSKLERDVVSNISMDSIDYIVLTGIAVVAAARYFGGARGSFRDDLNNKCVCLTRCFKCLETQHLSWHFVPNLLICVKKSYKYHMEVSLTCYRVNVGNIINLTCHPRHNLRGRSQLSTFTY